MSGSKTLHGTRDGRQPVSLFGLGHGLNLSKGRTTYKLLL